MTAPSDRTGFGVGLMMIVLTLVSWSSIPLFLEHFSHLIDAWTSNGWRYGFSALLWAPVLILGVLRRQLPAGLWGAAVVPSVINAMGQVTFTVAHYNIDPGLLTFGLRSQMLFVAVGAYLMFASERAIIRSPLYLVGMVALMIGTTITVLAGETTFEGAHAFGVLLSILSGAFFAAYGLAVRKYMHSYNAVVAFAAISQYTAGAMVVLMVLFGSGAGIEAARLSMGQFGLLLLSAVIGIAVGHVLYYISIARLGVAISSGVLQLHPFLVSIGSMWLFGERLTGVQWVAGTIAVVGALMMCGSYVVNGKRNMTERGRGGASA